MPGGIVSATGVAGFTLGGGFGWVTRRYGFAADQLVAADVVTADGQARRASADDNPDLFWAMRRRRQLRLGDIIRIPGAAARS